MSEEYIPQDSTLERLKHFMAVYRASGGSRIQKPFNSTSFQVEVMASSVHITPSPLEIHESVDFQELRELYGLKERDEIIITDEGVSFSLHDKEIEKEEH